MHDTAIADDVLTGSRTPEAGRRSSVVGRRSPRLVTCSL